jgi:hypothetical protein
MQVPECGSVEPLCQQYQNQPNYVRGDDVAPTRPWDAPPPFAPTAKALSQTQPCG